MTEDSYHSISCLVCLLWMLCRSFSSLYVLTLFSMSGHDACSRMECISVCSSSDNIPSLSNLEVFAVQNSTSV